ncbi:MAG: hypothetical protein R3C03_00585 [Pirellulaceae bacterium]
MHDSDNYGETTEATPLATERSPIGFRYHIVAVFACITIAGMIGLAKYQEEFGTTDIRKIEHTFESITYFESMIWIDAAYIFLSCMMLYRLSRTNWRDNQSPGGLVALRYGIAMVPSLIVLIYRQWVDQNEPETLGALGFPTETVLDFRYGFKSSVGYWQMAWLFSAAYILKGYWRLVFTLLWLAAFCRFCISFFINLTARTVTSCPNLRC